MALTAEKLAKEFKVQRQEVDEFALRSQQLWLKGKIIIISHKKNLDRKLRHDLFLLSK